MQTFQEWTENEKLKEEVRHLVYRLESENPGLKLFAFVDSSGALEIDRITVQTREQGTGTKVMRKLCDFADQKGMVMVLSPSSDFGGSITRLKKFYARFGFVMNTGRKKDFRFRSTMIRMPHGSDSQVRGGRPGLGASEKQTLQNGDLGAG